MTPSTPADGTDLARMRRDYLAGPGADHGLDETEMAPDWLTQFGHWLADAITAAGHAVVNFNIVERK